MVAKINVGSSLFGALSYNQKKIDGGLAKVLFSNRVIQHTDGSHTMYFNLKSFEPYLDANKQTGKPVLHISINPHPDDVLTDDNLSDIAQEYMEKMGYANQPYLVYKHEDIDRHHLHIVSVNVDETGRKISDSNDYRRSKNITRELEKKYNLIPAEKKHYFEKLPLKPVDLKEGDVKKQVANITKSLMSEYKFQSIYEYRALLSLYNITVEEVKGEVWGKPYNGLVYSALDKNGQKVGNPFKASLIGRSVGYDALQKHFISTQRIFKEKDFKSRTKDIVSTAMKNCKSRKGFENDLLKNGVSVVFRQNDEGRIYGVTFIDHRQKAVLNGSKLGKEFSANVFHGLFNNQNKIEDKDYDYRIDRTITGDNPDFHTQKQDGDSAFEAVASVFSMEQHGDNYQEIAFANRMKRKKKKPKGPKL